VVELQYDDVDLPAINARVISQVVNHECVQFDIYRPVAASYVRPVLGLVGPIIGSRA
jgi:hypothetical protein